MKRVFIALDISDEARRRASDHINELRHSYSRLRVGWERPEKLHITLKFLGGVSDAELTGVEAVVGDVARNYSALEMQLAGTGTFPEKGDARILWLGIEAPAEMAAIAVAIEKQCSKLGFEPERRKFSPHLTIARLREPKVSRELAIAHRTAHFDTVHFSADEITIYESQLQPTGSIYSRLAAFPLKTASY